MFYDPKDELSDSVGRPQRVRATNGRAAYLAAWALLAALTLVSLYAVCATFGCNAGAPTLPAAPPGRVLVKLAEGEDESSLAGYRIVGRIPQIGVVIVEAVDSAASVRSLCGESCVEFAEEDRFVPPAIVPNDFYYSYEWHLPKIGAPATWDRTTGDSGVVIAILDTGVNTSHADLFAKCVPGWNIYDGNADTTDINGHGTAVAGAAAAMTNNGIGVAAIAWGCSIMPIRISRPDSYGSFSTMAEGLLWAADHGARVANISYAPVSSSSTVTTAADYFRAAGGVVTVSSGNFGDFDATADNPSVLTVSATDQNDLVPAWSTIGNNVDLGAPGVGIFSTSIGGGYLSGTGTSASAPIVAGVAALVMSANPALSSMEVEDILKQSADDLGPTGWDMSYGWGRVNAARAVAMALGESPDPPPTPDATPPTIQIVYPADGAIVRRPTGVKVEVWDDVGVVRIDLLVDGAFYKSTTSAPWTINWNARKASPGAHTLVCRAVDAAGNVGASDAVGVVR